MSLQPPPDDLPAAHSMDTEWFAIDGNGHVGVFDSGEGGGVPEAHFDVWHAQSYWDQLLEELLALTPPGELAFVDDEVWTKLDGRFSSGTLCTELGDIDTSWQWETSVLLELPAPVDASRVAAAVAGGRLLGCATPLVFSPRCLPATLPGAWHELGVVRMIIRPQLGPERFGLYAFACEDYSGGPYERVGKPLGAPLRVESLPTELRRRLGQVRLGAANFERDAAIQPFEHVPSTIWGNQWIGTDGVVHEAD